MAHNFDERASELALVRTDHPSAELLVKNLLAIADAKQWNPAFKQDSRGALTVVVGYRGGSATEDYAPWTKPLEPFISAVERSDLAINPGFAYPPRNQLRDLASKVDNEDRLLGADRHVGPIRTIIVRVKLPFGQACRPSPWKIELRLQPFEPTARKSTCNSS